jgi:hypothetical protein
MLFQGEWKIQPEVPPGFGRSPSLSPFGLIVGTFSGMTPD